MDVNSSSSDSDSDYIPEDVIKSRSRSRKKSKTTGIKKWRGDRSSNHCTPSMSSLMELPLELMVMIFQYIVAQYGPFLTLKRYGLVCKKWRLALLENALWQTVTLDGKELIIKEALIWLYKFKYCTVKDLTMSSWKLSQSNSSFDQLLQICCQVKCMKFNNCMLTFERVFKCLDQVEKLTIAHCNVKNFNTMIQTCKERLRYLSLIDVGSSTSLCSSLSKGNASLPQLNTLQLDNFGNFRVDSINLLQKMCPNLIHLQLCFVSSTVSRGFQPVLSLNGFPNLKYLELTFHVFNDGVCASDLCLLLAASPNLQFLSLIHYTHACTVNYDKLVSLMSSNLTELALFYCKLNFNELLSKLLHCYDALLRLTIASPKGQRVTDDIIAIIIASPCANTLQYLDLSGTDVTINGIRSLLNSVCNLKHLDLLRCRYLPRGTRRLYSNPADLDKLIKA